tara:strand:+ start:3052 stop:3672 length:621 start_codon:yes stop_codon:yes gene_type:complete
VFHSFTELEEVKMKCYEATLFWPLHIHKTYNSKFRRCIDIGGYKGKYSSLYASLFKRVETFEPNQKIWPEFYSNTKYYTNITLYKLGVSNYIGSSDFFCNDVNSGMCTTVPKYATLSDNFKSPIKINVTTIDSMNFTDVDFIKIDAEGADKKIILGAMETINTYHPTIQIEYRDTKLTNQLEKNGYKLMNTKKLQNLTDEVWVYSQ